MRSSVLFGIGLIGSLSLAVACTQLTSEPRISDSAELGAATGPSLVISQIYAGGGLRGATREASYVELFNRGTEEVSLDGVSIQFAAADAPFSESESSVTLPNKKLPPKKYFLVQLGPVTAGMAPNGTVDADYEGRAGAAVRLATTGKIALTNGGTRLDGCGSADSKCPAAKYVDLVGFGPASQANGQPTDALGANVAATRQVGGCVDTQNNKADFALSPPAPHNLESAAATCAVEGDGADAGADASADASDGAAPPKPPAGSSASSSSSSTSAGGAAPAEASADAPAPAAPAAAPGDKDKKSGVQSAESVCNFAPGGSRGPGGFALFAMIGLGLAALRRRKA